ncbi:MAG: putative rane protein [Glaciihabitans sp.]|jgi:hypothetical protein|nr:putative rane protein [Glaciihabitans sp.]
MDADDAGRSPVPAGWFADPAGSDNLRWWDGAAWTTQLRSVPLVPAFAPAPGYLAPTVTHPATQQEPVYVPFQSEQRQVHSMPVRGISYTRAVWWIATYPIWASVPQVVVLAILSSFVARPGMQLVLALVAINFVDWLILIRLAFADHTALIRGGNRQAASPWWTLLSPLAYLIARAVEIKNWDSSGWGALIWFVVASVVAPLLAVVAFFGALGILP